MIHKKILFFVLLFILALFFTSCENGVSFAPSDDLFTDDGTNNEIPDDGGDGNGDDGETETPEGTGSYSFDFGFTTETVLENFEFISPSDKPQVVLSAGINDTTGDGFKTTFTLTIDVPDTVEVNPVPEGDTPASLNVSNEGEGESEETPAPEVSQDVTLTIGDYIKRVGADEFPEIYFGEDSTAKTFSFTPEVKTVTLTVEYKNSASLQMGTLPISFAYEPTVYTNNMPRKLLLSVYSKGTAITNRVILNELIEQNDDKIVKIHKPDDYVLLIEGESSESATKTDYEIPLQMSFSGILADNPITLIVKEGNENLDISNIVMQGNLVTFTAKHSGIDKLHTSTGKVTLEVSSANNDAYVGLPFDIVINTQRDETFRHFINDYVDNFTVSTSDDNNFDDGYYTELTIRPMGISGASKDDTLIYEIYRKDDSSTEFKLIHTTPPKAVTKSFTYKDRNALILRNSKQEYKIKIIHGSCTNSKPCTSNESAVQRGSRLLTEKELFLAVMDSIRYALIDGRAHFDVNTHTAGRGTFEHDRWYNGGAVSWSHAYTLNNYKPHFMALTGSFAYQADVGGYQAWEAEDIIDTVNSSWIHGKAPFTGTINFTSDYGDGSIRFNNVNINNNTWSNPSWADGDITVTIGENEGTPYGKDDVPFGFYMTSSEFLAKVLGESGNYTQK